MALVCPAGHPPGVGTKFCRLCGRDYVDEPNPLLQSLAPPATEAVIPVQAPSVESVTVPAAPWPPAPLPLVPSDVTGPPAQAVPAPAAPTPYELIPVPATGGLQVHLPLAELPDLSAASELDAVVAPQPGKPAPTDTHPLELGGPVLTAPEEEPVAAPRVWDRTTLLVGAVAGFVGGAVSGATLTVFLT